MKNIKQVDFRTEEVSECGFATTITGNIGGRAFNLYLNNRDHTMGVVMVDAIGKENPNQDQYNALKDQVLEVWKLRNIHVNVETLKIK